MNKILLVLAFAGTFVNAWTGIHPLRSPGKVEAPIKEIKMVQNPTWEKPELFKIEEGFRDILEKAVGPVLSKYGDAFKTLGKIRDETGDRLVKSLELWVYGAREGFAISGKQAQDNVAEPMTRQMQTWLQYNISQIRHEIERQPAKIVDLLKNNTLTYVKAKQEVLNVADNLIKEPKQWGWIQGYLNKVKKIIAENEPTAANLGEAKLEFKKAFFEPRAHEFTFKNIKIVLEALRERQGRTTATKNVDIAKNAMKIRTLERLLELAKKTETVPGQLLEKAKNSGKWVDLLEARDEVKQLKVEASNADVEWNKERLSILGAFNIPKLAATLAEDRKREDDAKKGLLQS